MEASGSSGLHRHYETTVCDRQAKNQPYAYAVSSQLISGLVRTRLTCV